MRIRDIRDVIGGGLLIGMGGAISLAAQGYGIGRMTDAGPGFFPAVLGGLMMLVGAGIGIASVDLRRDGPRAAPLRLEGWHLWCLLLIASGFVLFGVLLPVAGLFVTCFVTIVTVAIGSRLLTPVGAVAIGFVLAASAVVLFRYLLDLQVQAWPWGG